MRKWVSSFGMILAFGAMCGTALLVQASDKTGEETAAANTNGEVMHKTIGAWQAQCFVDGSSPDPYCRIMVKHFFNKSQKGLDFVQFGPAFDRGQVGFVVASYYGYATESHITVGIDDHAPINMPSPKQGNSIVAPPDIANVLVEQMQNGKEIYVAFKSPVRGQKKLTYPLAGFDELKAEATRVMAGKPDQ